MKFIFDLDGTICFKGRPLSEAMVRALDALAQKGHEIVFASARPIRDLLPVLPPHMHDWPMIGGNGAFVAIGGRIVSTSPFDRTVAEEILKLLRTYEAEYLVDSNWDYAYTGSEEHPIRRNLDPERRAQNLPVEALAEIVKVVVLRSRDGERMLEALRKLPIVLYRHGAEEIWDMSPNGVDKWTGLQAMGIAPRQYIAFGNDANDVALFKHALRSVCVGDHAELSRLATERVASAEEHVVRKIQEMLEEHQASNNTCPVRLKS
ncbi:HAD-IIB family hydrolase [Cohnella nanjingensis]|uniref:HAD family phosphatase n=1 Tax=Cohnella nanjingensis TaxID=1387779 RepID=A0A7X0RL77_9BACL|nr:HAD-IIB family hydrolase [Cohnella nanjingensis]MBB6669527.1 HAD family phosphatase [Cohnella nanjingensis]